MQFIKSYKLIQYSSVLYICLFCNNLTTKSGLESKLKSQNENGRDRLGKRPRSPY